MLKIVSAYKSRKVESPQLQKMKKAFDEIGKIQDLGQRLLAYRDLHVEIKNKPKPIRDYRDLPSRLVGTAILLLIIVGFSPLATTALMAGLSVGACVAIATFMAADGVGARDATVLGHVVLEKEVLREMDTLQKRNPLDFSKSSSFDRVMSEYPDLKHQFMFAVAKNAAQQGKDQPKDEPSVTADALNPEDTELKQDIKPMRPLKVGAKRPSLNL